MIAWSLSLFAWSLIGCVPQPASGVSLEPAELAEQPAEAALAVEAPVAWPDSSAALHHPVLEVPEGFEVQEVFVVAGHGTRGGEGNLGSWCVREQDFTLRAAQSLSALLDATGQFVAIQARTGTQRPSYRSRLRHLERSGATAMIELHSDARADAMTANAVSEDGETCWRDDGEPGFTILVADRDAGPQLVARRLALARSLATAMADAGFPPWVGDNYQGLYEADEVPGVWLDRRNLFMLRKPRVPSVIIETHNAKDGRETLRWEEPQTHDAFGRAMIAGLIDFYSQR